MSEEFKNDEGEIITKSAYKKLQKEKEKAAKKKEVEERLAKEKAEREKEEAVDVSIGKYGNTDIIRSKDGDKHGKRIHDHYEEYQSQFNNRRKI